MSGAEGTFEDVRNVLVHIIRCVPASGLETLWKLNWTVDNTCLPILQCQSAEIQMNDFPFGSWCSIDQLYDKFAINLMAQYPSVICLL